MKNIIVLLALLFASSTTHSHDEDYIYNSLELIIAPSFEPVTAYLVMNEDIDEPLLLKATFSDWKNYRSMTINTERVIKLSPSQLDEIKNLTKKALIKIKLDDDVRGFDGAQWIVKSNIYQDITLSIWSPYLDAEKRGYTNLLKLKGHLESLF